MISTTDLMYAAYLLSLGATVEHTEKCGKYTKIYIKVPNYALQQNTDKTSRLARISDRAESTEELAIIYDQSILQDISTNYYALKRRIARIK